MLIQELWVTKITQTYADTLIAVGLAKLLSVWPDLQRVAVTDHGDHYQLLLPKPLDTAAEYPQHLTPVYPFILFRPTDAKPKSQIGMIDYGRERAKEDIYRKFQDASKGKVGNAVTNHIASIPSEPRIDLQLLKDFNSLRMSSPAYAKLYLALEEQANLSTILMQRLHSYLPPGAAPEWASITEPPMPAANLQLFSPISGKGVHRPKPDGTGLGGLNANMVDWFEEWMKYIAMHEIMTSHRSGDDTTILVLAPHALDADGWSKVRADLLEQKLWGNIKLEILAVLTVAKSLISHSEFIKKSGAIRTRGKRPNQLVSGLFSAYFKSLGTGKALMNNAFLGLPGWFPIEDTADAEAWLSIIEEHQTCLKTLLEDHSDHVRLLTAYRDFIASGKLDDLLRFTVAYGTHVMRRLADKQWVVQLSVRNLRRLFMSYELTGIVENEGFLHVATAIRKATVSAQYRKASGRQVFSIHYGLAQDWKRKMKFDCEFVPALMDFAQEYNMENARHVEQGKETRARLTTADLNQVIHLIEQHGSELVGMLLLAYGYAKEAGEKEEEKE